MLSNAVNNPGQQVDCQLVVQSVQPTKYNDNGKAYQQAVLRDPSENADYNVKIWQGKGNPLNPTHVNQTLPFRIKARVSEYDRKTHLSGFWQQPRGQQTPQAPPASAGQAKAPIGGVGQPRGNKDKLIVAQVVYKELSAKFTDPNEWDVWLMKNLPVIKRHVQLLMDIAEGKSNPAPPAEQGGYPPAGGGNPNPDYDPDYVPPADEVPF